MSSEILSLMKILIVTPDKGLRSKFIKRFLDIPARPMTLPNTTYMPRIVFDPYVAGKLWTVIDSRSSLYWSHVEFSHSELIPIGYADCNDLGVSVVLLAIEEGLLYILRQNIGCLIYNVLSPDKLPEPVLIHVKDDKLTTNSPTSTKSTSTNGDSSRTRTQGR